MTTRFCKGVRAGDEWVYQTNSGGISRIIVGFDDDTVFYRSYGDIYEKRCKAATFNRWLKGARLEFRRPSGVQPVEVPSSDAVLGEVRNLAAHGGMYLQERQYGHARTAFDLIVQAVDVARAAGATPTPQEKQS